MTEVDRPTATVAVPSRSDDPAGEEVVFEVEGLTVSYGPKTALRDVTMHIYKHRVTAFIGPSGCGKSTFIRCFNRMNDLIVGASVEGRVLYHGQDLYAPGIDAESVPQVDQGERGVRPAGARPDEGSGCAS